MEEDVRALMEQAQKLREDLLSCVEKDAEAFEPLSKAYGLPKDDPDRDAVLEKCLKDAAAVPMEILKLSCSAVELLRDFAAKGSRLMLSDAATGAAMCRAAITGAAMNVRVNTKLMKDKVFADKTDAETDALVQKYTKLADEVFASVYNG